jgi:hypothetical protein
MAALVQTIPQHTSTVPVLQTRPSSSSGTFASSPQTQGSRYQNMSWSSFNAANSGSYRTGQPIVAPYAFAPNLGHPSSPQQHRQSWSPHLRPEHRTFSAPTIPQGPMMSYAGGNPRVAHPAAGSVSNTSSSNSSFRSYVSKDDTAIPSRQPRSDQPLRPLSTANLPSPVTNISSPTGAVKPSPNRPRLLTTRRAALRLYLFGLSSDPLTAASRAWMIRLIRRRRLRSDTVGGAWATWTLRLFPACSFNCPRRRPRRLNPVPTTSFRSNRIPGRTHLTPAGIVQGATTRDVRLLLR